MNCTVEITSNQCETVLTSDIHIVDVSETKKKENDTNTLEYFTSKSSSIKNDEKKVGEGSSSLQIREICEESVFKGEYLKIKHKKNQTSKFYVCAACKKSFSSSTRLKKHKRTHTGDKPFSRKTGKKAFSG